MTRRKADIPSGPSPSHDELSQGLGYNFASALSGKRAWLGAELLRLKREESSGHGHGMDGDDTRMS